MRHKRADSAFVNDMLEACEKLTAYTSNMSFEVWSHDDKTIDAVIRRFTVLGEAASQVSQEFRNTHRQIPWRKATDLRNVVVHFYHGVDMRTLWDTAKDIIPELTQQLRDLRKKLDVPPL